MLSETTHRGLGTGYPMYLLGTHFNFTLPPHPLYCNRGTFDQLACALTAAVNGCCYSPIFTRWQHWFVNFAVDGSSTVSVTVTATTTFMRSFPHLVAAKIIYHYSHIPYFRDYINNFTD